MTTLSNTPVFREGMITAWMPGGGVALHVEYQGDWVSVSTRDDDPMPMWGEGHSLDQALVDFTDSCRDYLAAFAEYEDRLADDLRPWLARMRELFPGA